LLPRGQPLAIDILEKVLQYFEGFGPLGLLIFLFVVFFLDAMLIPTLPEFFVMAFFASNPSPEWALRLLAVVSFAEVTSNFFLYSIVKRRGLPHFLETRMEKWVKFLIVSDERLILLNRVVPVVPVMGAFIATMKWNLGKSLLYVLVGSLVKYAILMAFVSVSFIYFERGTARNLTFVLIVAVIAVSLIQSHYAKLKRLGPLANRVAHLGEHSSAATAPLVKPRDDQNDGSAKDSRKQQQAETPAGRS
jgi:membrane protein YqaA with SNARE-associated domain